MGGIRVLDEGSRYIPMLGKADETMDIGFFAREDGIFLAGECRKTGNVVIFANDMVERSHERYFTNNLNMIVHTIGSVAVSGAVQGKLSKQCR